MNNSNGAALLARIRAGSIVTIRDSRGAMLTGRAEYVLGHWQVVTRDCHAERVTAGNVTLVQP